MAICRVHRTLASYWDRPAGDMDVLVAATAVAFGHKLITRNPAHFSDIPHLRVELTASVDLHGLLC